jgi:hypothetical protein
MEAPEPKLELLYDMHADLEAPQVLAGTPAGLRQIFIVKGGTVEGPRIKGKILPGGGDWARFEPTARSSSTSAVPSRQTTARSSTRPTAG